MNWRHGVEGAVLILMVVAALALALGHAGAPAMSLGSRQVLP